MRAVDVIRQVSDSPLAGRIASKLNEFPTVGAIHAERSVRLANSGDIGIDASSVLL